MQEALKSVEIGRLKRDRDMTTEVQIGQNRIHLLHLRKVISRIAPLAGLSRKETQDTQDAVCEACVDRIAATPEDGNVAVAVKLSADDSGFTVEITGPSGNPADPPDTGHGSDPPDALATVRRLVDRAEVSRENGVLNIRLVKCARKASGRSVKSPAYLAAAGSTSLQI